VTLQIPEIFLRHSPPLIREVAEGLWLRRALVSERDYEIRLGTHGVLLLLEGSKSLRDRESLRTLRGASATLFSKGPYFLSRNTLPYRAVSIFFDGSYLAHLRKSLSLTKGPPIENPSLTVPIARDASLHHLCEAIWEALGQKRSGLPGLWELRIRTLLAQLIEDGGPGVLRFLRGLDESRYDELDEVRLQECLSVDEMALVSNLSRSELYRRFRQRYGTSPGAWLRSRRLERAAALLRHRDDPISTVAAACGFGNVSWFIEAFRHSYGITPLQYRRQKRDF